MYLFFASQRHFLSAQTTKKSTFFNMPNVDLWFVVDKKKLYIHGILSDILVCEPETSFLGCKHKHMLKKPDNFGVLYHLLSMEFY